MCRTFGALSPPVRHRELWRFGKPGAYQWLDLFFYGYPGSPCSLPSRHLSSAGGSGDILMIGNNRTHIYHRSHEAFWHWRSVSLKLYTNCAGRSTPGLSPTVSWRGELPCQDLEMQQDVCCTERLP